MEHLSDFAFVSMVNVTLCRIDSYLAHEVRTETRHTGSIMWDLPTLFPDSVLKRAEEDIGRFEDKGRSQGQSGDRRDNRFYPYKQLDKQTQEQRSGKPAWKQLGRFNKQKKVVDSQTTYEATEEAAYLMQARLCYLQGRGGGNCSR